MSDYPLHEDIWAQNRDNINMVLGGILGAFLGLSISRMGLEKGTYLDLFSLITFTAYGTGAIITFGNRSINGNYLIGFTILLTSALPVWLSLKSASKLGIDPYILAVILAAWFFLVFCQIIAFETAKFLKKKKQHDTN